jgi:hypothetical protein
LAIFNDRGGVFDWSVAHVNVAPLAPGSAVHNDGFPLSKELTEATRLVSLSAESSKSS